MNFNSEYGLYVSRGFAFGEEQWEKYFTYDSLKDVRSALRLLQKKDSTMRYKIVKVKLMEIGQQHSQEYHKIAIANYRSTKI